MMGYMLSIPMRCLLDAFSACACWVGPVLSYHFDRLRPLVHQKGMSMA